MNQFPLLSAIGRGTWKLASYPLVFLALLIVGELLPLLLVHPYVIYWLGFESTPETFTNWLHPWAYSQIVILGFAAAALPGRWHVRVGLALLAVGWIWGAYMTGIQSSLWPLSWFSPRVSRLAGHLIWLFACSTFMASLVVSVSGLQLEMEPRWPRRGTPRRGQFSLGFLMTVMFALTLTLLAFRAFRETPVHWLEAKSLLAIDGLQLLQFAVWGLLGSLSMLAAISSRWHWLWLPVIVALGITAGSLLNWAGHTVPGGWWMPVAIAGHAFAFALLLPRLGVQLPRIARLESLHRALASVR